MSGWLLAHLWLAFFSASGVVLLALVLLNCSRDPVARHRLLLCFLPVLLLMPVAQLVVSELSTLTSPSATTRASAPPRGVAATATDDAARPAHGSVVGPAPDSPLRPVPRPPAWKRAGVSVTAAAYAIGAMALLLVALLRVARAAHLLRRCTHVREPRVVSLWRSLLPSYPGATHASLLQCDRTASPGCWGLRRASVVLPAADVATPDTDRLALVLRHELVHVARRDVAATLAQHLLRAIMWFNPLVWLYSKLLSRYRELSCDAIVVRQTGQHQSYARALLEYCHAHRRTARVPGPLGGIALSMANRDIHRRLNMILSEQELRTKARRFPPGVAGAFAAVAFAASIGAAAALNPGPMPGARAWASPAGVTAQPEPAKATPPEPVDTRTLLLRLVEGRLTLDKPDLRVAERLRVELPQDRRDAAIRLSVQRLLLERGVAGGTRLEGTLTDQETLISSESASLRANVLLAPECILNMPEGSRLRATFEAESIEVTQPPGPTEPLRLTARRAVMRLTDDTGVHRITLRASREGVFHIKPRIETTPNAEGANIRLEVEPPAEGTLVVTIQEDKGEVVMRFKATKADGSPTGIEAELDLKTGVPAGEKDPPHGAVRYRLLDEGHEDGKPLSVKMQWITELSKLGNADEQSKK